MISLFYNITYGVGTVTALGLNAGAAGGIQVVGQPINGNTITTGTGTLTLGNTTINVSNNGAFLGGSINTAASATQAGGKINTQGTAGSGTPALFAITIRPPTTSGNGASLNMNGGTTGIGGDINTSGSSIFAGGSINTKASFSNAGGSINTSGGSVTGATGGSINTNGAATGSTSAGGNIDTSGGSVSGSNGGSINTNGAASLSNAIGGSISTAGHVNGGSGGNISTGGNVAAGGPITTVGGSATSAFGGSINTQGGTSVSAVGGSIATYGETAPGGSIDTFASGALAGGSINTSAGGGSIDTRGFGNIGFGISGTRTTVVGQAASNITVTLPPVAGTLASLAAVQTFLETQTFRTGTAAAGTSPLKLVAGVNMTTPEAGAIEYNGNALLVTNVGAIRTSMVEAMSLCLARTTVPASSTTPVTVETITIPANSQTNPRQIETRIRGLITQRANAASFYTIDFKLNGTTLVSYITPSGTQAASTFYVDFIYTLRTTGAGGTGIAWAQGAINGTIASQTASVSTAVDTTATNTFTIVVTANENNAGTGPVHIDQCRSISIENMA